MCPNSVLSKLKERYVSKAELEASSTEYSIVFYIPNTDKIVGYVLTKEKNIPHYAEVFKRQQSIVDFLSKANGLYIRKIVLHPNLGNEGITAVLNTLHYVYCNDNFKDRTKYIWMNNGEILFSPTWQENDRFFVAAPNRVAKALGRALYETSLSEKTILK